jgi:DNA-binding response OmpR family regulator
MTQEAPIPAPCTVALVCGEPRLRRILRLALEAGGYGVRDYRAPRDVPVSSVVVAAVVDLDSLRPYQSADGLPDTMPALLISVYPAEAEERLRPGPADYLQPPFRADELISRVGRLLGATRAPDAADQIPGGLSPAR